MKDKKHKTIMGPVRSGKTVAFCLSDYLDCNTVSDEVRNGIKKHCSTQNEVKPFVVVQSINETDQ